LVLYILGSIHICPVGLNLFASAHIHSLPPRALLRYLKPQGSVLGPLPFIYTTGLHGNGDGGNPAEKNAGMGTDIAGIQRRWNWNLRGSRRYGIYYHGKSAAFIWKTWVRQIYDV